MIWLLQRGSELYVYLQRHSNDGDWALTLAARPLRHLFLVLPHTLEFLKNQGELVVMYSILNIHNRRTMKHNSRIHVLSPIGHAKRALAQSRPGGAFENPGETVKPFKACTCKVLTTWQNAHTTHLRSIDSGQISIDFVNAIDRECSRERTWRPILKTDRTEYGESVLRSSAARLLS